MYPNVVDAAFAPITYRYKHHIFTIDPDHHKSWQSSAEVWTHNGKEVQPPSAFRIDGDVVPSLPDGFEKRITYQWDLDAIRTTILEEIAQYLDREPGVVIISMGLNGKATFDGVGLPGRRVLLDDAAALTKEAIIKGVTDIILPVEELQPEITVRDPALKKKGIREVVSVGESDFRGSPYNRTHNIGVGLDQFNGHLIPQGEQFSFNEVLGPVNGAAGYLKELVIKGDKTLPDYGGGLCQVSTTAYRGIWEYGFPIAQRINHSYSVRYYFPQGTDATIYPPYKDVKFVNDSPGAILIQTHVADGRAYFIYYGTKDDRESELIGPFVWGRTSVPADKIEYTTEIEPGTERKVGERVPGAKAAWFRLLKTNGAEEYAIEPYYSTYEARPSYTQIGVDTLLEPVEDHEREEATEDTAEESPVRRWVDRIRIRN